MLTVAGRTTHAEVLATVAPALASMPAGRLPRFTRWKLPAAKTHAVVDRRDTEQAQLVLGFVAPGRHDPDRFAARLLNAMLGEKADSRLFQSLRERRGLCYSVQSEFSTLDDTGLLTISAGLDTKHLRAALGLIRREIDRLCDGSIGARETREARDYLVGQHRLGLESTTNQMMWLGESLLGHGRIVLPGDVEAAFAGLTPADVQAAAKACLRRGFRALVAVGPVEVGGDALLRWFEAA